MYWAALARAGRMLEKGDWSDKAIALVVDYLEHLAETIAGALESPLDQYSSAMDVEIGGTAEAEGEHTRAKADLTAELSDTEYGSFAVGSGTFSAAAEGGAETATTNAFCDVDGADFVFTRTTTTTGENWSETRTQMIAVDFACIDMDSTLMITPESSYRLGTYQHVESGNVATVDFDVEVNATHSYAEVSTGAIAVEDTYSGSSIEATLAIG
ncbi:hypothetical protein LCM28_07100 [Salipiger pacificus]|nr:hypothetical protein [Alloyangia pacifica]